MKIVNKSVISNRENYLRLLDRLHGMYEQLQTDDIIKVTAFSAMLSNHILMLCRGTNGSRASTGTTLHLSWQPEETCLIRFWYMPRIDGTDVRDLGFLTERRALSRSSSKGCDEADTWCFRLCSRFRVHSSRHQGTDIQLGSIQYQKDLHTFCSPKISFIGIEMILWTLQWQTLGWAWC